MTIMTPEVLGTWHMAEIASPIARDPQVQAVKNKVFPGDMHGQAAYQMYLELQSLHDVVPEMAEIAYMQVTACALGAWIDTRRGWIPRNFPIEGGDVDLFYNIMYRNVFNNDGIITFPERRGQNGVDIGIRLPMHLLFENVLKVQEQDLLADPRAREVYMTGYNLALERWRDLTTQA